MVLWIGGWLLMKKNSLWTKEGCIYRVLEVQQEQVFIIDCLKKTMPKWANKVILKGFQPCSEDELLEKTSTVICDIELLDMESKRFIHEHFSLVAGVLPFVSDEEKRCYTISQIAEERNVSKQTIRNYLCQYLIYQDMSVFAPKKRNKERVLTQDEKNIRWGLNKFYYTKNKNSLKTAYTMMLKAKYCDKCGVLLPKYPSFDQFRYFYRKNRSMQTYYISRNGLKNYQRNNRPLTGDGIQEFAPYVGIGMLDATICDIYLINESGNLVGRPILTACVDAYSGLCCGYSLSWEGGVYSLRGLMLNVITDKVEHCRKYGISIEKSEWDCSMLPATLVTDMGSEYKSENFEQIAELGVRVINLPAYRPELKGNVEKFFDLIQELYKPYLRGKGVIEPDFQERGAHDYRKDACLTMEQFEKILLRCIIYYNKSRILENYPYTEEMLLEKIQPYANEIWNYGKRQMAADLIQITQEQLILTLLPRTEGKFGRFGLKANKMRYKHDNYTEMYLKGNTVTVAYNPDDVSYVWLLENGKYIRFELIESRFRGEKLEKVVEIQNQKKEIIKSVSEENIQARIELADHIQTIAEFSVGRGEAGKKSIRNTRKREQGKSHRDYVKEGVLNV